ncbi:MULTISPECIES: phosphatidate cytidylyltransferase [Microbacterium]|jgi:phosphatidate cytidylyltransferase|uniref:phosphatidate cytidylyltransferase n=1 Tax=Microbacterium TaxID=33882 RepID=UPI0010F955FC|nr:phosphatidate cytidylyltransferase [Microbacterium sp. 4NA327F11]MCK9916821.1 phosphatidate cytidylyltransferase [Microbacteriaceae bacterium K1510]
MSDSSRDADPSPDTVPGGHGSMRRSSRAPRNEFELQMAHARAEFEEANERIKQRTGRDLILAIVIGLAIGLVVFVSLVFANWPFALFALAVAVLGVFEFARALQGDGRKIDLIPQVAIAVIVPATAYLLGPWQMWVALFCGVVVAIVWRLVGQMIERDGRTYGNVVDDVLLATFVPLYVPFLASLAILLLRQPHGEWWVMAFLIITIVADTGAYVSGLTLGRHPMAPKISPKKTWEGFAGAAVLSVVGAILLAWLMLGLPWWTGIIIGLVILGTATAGDLGESMIKRDLGIKDMSSWLPGHGGVLDRLDSILPSAGAALALYYVFFPMGVVS